MRAIWKGAISFGLVNIPIALYPATRREELKFHLLRKSDSSPIKYKRVAEVDGKEVAWQDIVKGFEYEKGRFVVLEDKDFERADIKATQTVEIFEFVALKDIDPMFFDTPYYLEPGKSGTKAYALLREALRRSDQVGIAKVVIKTRQHLAAIKPEQNVLVLELMHFAEELVNPGTLQIPGAVDVSSRELSMASELIERMAGKWKPEQYADDYRHALLELIQKKVEAGGQSLPALVSKRQTANVIDLVSVLKQSLEQSGSRRAKPSQRMAKKAYRGRKGLKKAA